MERIKQHLSSSLIQQEPSQTSVLVTLNNPKALNSLNVEMIDTISSILHQSIERGQRLVFRGNGRAFCAGGDVVTIAKDPNHAVEFFAKEFTLFYQISGHPLETVSILDGIVMGGGVGLSQSCKIKVASEKTLWAMPLPTRTA